MDSRRKRSLDVVVATAGMVCTVPLWVAIALAIRLTSPGPIFYRGRRVGKDGRLFPMYKFRTMRQDADRIGPSVTATDDPRVTRVGRALRLTKLDELPQLLNVLRGEMSLVGPRPEAPEYVAHYDPRQLQVLAVRPGITGPTQLAYRHEERLLQHSNAEDRYLNELLPHKLEMDLAYLRGWSLGQDLHLILATLRQLVGRQAESAVPDFAGKNTSFSG